MTVNVFLLSYAIFRIAARRFRIAPDDGGLPWRHYSARSGRMRALHRWPEEEE